MLLSNIGNQSSEKAPIFCTQVPRFAEVIGQGDSNLAGLCSASGCVISPPYPQQRSHAGFDVALSSGSVLGLVMGLNLLHDSLENVDNLKRVNFANLDPKELNTSSYWGRRPSMEALIKDYLGDFHTLAAAQIFQATFSVKPDEVLPVLLP